MLKRNSQEQEKKRNAIARLELGRENKLQPNRAKQVPRLK